MKRRALVVGAGIGGLTAALALRGAGLEVVVLERDAAIREAGAGISLWPNAVKVLRRLDLGDAVDAVAAVHSESGLREPLLVLHRAALRALLRQALDRGVLQLGADCTSVDQRDKEVNVTLADGRSVQGDVLIGADGFRSRVRAVAFSDDAPRYSGFTVWRGVVPLDGTLASRINPAESWRRGAVFGVLRLLGSQAFWYASARTDENEGESAAEQKMTLLRRFAYWQDPIPELVEATAAEAIARTSLYDSPPLARWATGRIALLGDGARGMLPNLARGACQAIEDAAALADALNASRDVAPALAAYDSQRRQREAKITWRSLQLRRIAHRSDPLGISQRAGRPLYTSRNGGARRR